MNNGPKVKLNLFRFRIEIKLKNKITSTAGVLENIILPLSYFLFQF